MSLEISGENTAQKARTPAWHINLVIWTIVDNKIIVGPWLFAYTIGPLIQIIDPSVTKDGLEKQSKLNKIRKDKLNR